jgi:hypothetical protein
MKSHPKTHEADIMVGEGLHGLHPAHKRPAIEKVPTPVLMGENHVRNQNHTGVDVQKGKHDPKDSKTGR